MQGFGAQVLCPKYVRSATVQNTTDKVITLAAKFQLNSQTYELAPGAEVKIEGEIAHDTWTEVDPLEKIAVLVDGQNSSERLFSSQSGVVVLKLKAVEQGNSVQLVD